MHAGAQDRNLYGQPRELQPFAMGSSTTGATPVEASLLAGSIEGLGGAAHAQHAQHGPPGFPQRPQNHNRQNAPFQAATAGVAPSPIPAAALTPVPVQKPAAPQQVPQAAVGVGTRVGSRSAADDPELNVRFDMPRDYLKRRCVFMLHMCASCVADVKLCFQQFAYV